MKCATSYCRNERAVRINGQSYGARCHKCRRRMYALNQPLRYRYDNQRSHAKARGIEFTIDFPTWRTLVLQSGYAIYTGPFGGDLTIDRIENLRGYEDGNLQVLTRCENSEKRNRRDQMRFSKAA